MAPIRELIVSRPKHWDGCLQLVAWYETKDDQLQFSAGHLTTAAYYRLDTDFDFYYGDNFGIGDPETQPYWKW